MLKTLSRNLQKSEGLQQSLITIVGNIFSSGISALSLILISRVLGPSLFGEFSFGFAIIMILARINEFGLNSSLMKYVGSSTNNKKRNIYFSIVLKYKLLISAGLLLVGALFFNSLNTIFKLDHPEIILLSFSLGLSTVYLEQLNAMLQSLHRFNQAVFSSIFQSFVKVVGTILLLLLKIRDVSWLFAFYVFAPLTPVIFYKRLLPKGIKITTKLFGQKEKNDLLGMAKHTGLANISTVLGSQVSVLFVQAYLTSYETGILGGVSKIQMLFSLVASSLGNVLFPRVSRYKTNADIFPYIKKSIALVSLIFSGLLISVLIAKPIILITIGSEYLPGLNLLYVLLAAVFTSIATIPFTALFYTFDENRYFSFTGILQVILILAGNFVLIPVFGLMGTAYTQLLTRVTIFIITIIWGTVSYKKSDLSG